MELILKQKVANLGNIGDRVKVKPGYGRNYLLPKGKATMATPENIAAFEARRAEFEKVAKDELSSAQARAAKLEGFKLTLTAKASCSARSATAISSKVCARPATRWSVPKSACRTARSARLASTPCSCICIPTSTSICRSSSSAKSNLPARR